MPRSHIFNFSSHNFCAEWKFDRFGLGQHFIPFINVSIEIAFCCSFFFLFAFFACIEKTKTVCSLFLFGFIFFLRRLPAVQIVYNTPIHCIASCSRFTNSFKRMCASARTTISFYIKNFQCFLFVNLKIAIAFKRSSSNRYHGIHVHCPYHPSTIHMYLASRSLFNYSLH